MVLAPGRITCILLLGTVLGLAGIATAQSDLAITDVDVQPSNPGPGDSVNVTATVESQGSEDPDDYTVIFHVGGQHLGNETGGSTDFLVSDTTEAESPNPWTAAIGRHVVNVTVNASSDDDPSNDHREMTLEIGPDLKPTSLSVDPSAPKEGDEVTFTADVDNVGPNASDPVPVAFRIDGQAVNSTTLDGLAAGEGGSVTATWVAEPGNHTVEVAVDPQGALSEVSEDNNVLSGDPLRVDALEPDLVVTRLATRPSFPEPGEQVQVTATIANRGDKDAAASTARLTVSNETIGDEPVDPLATGEEVDLTWSWNASVGIHTLRAKADVGDDVPEGREKNNMRQLSVVVGPDLRIEDLTLTPSDPEAGDQVRLDATLANQGPAVPGNVTVQLLLDGVPIGSRVVEGLGANATHKVTFGPVNASEGEHTFTVAVDPDDAIGEAREDNNLADRTVTIPGELPNIVVEEASLTRSAFGPGEKTAFEATLANTGGDTGSFEVAFRVDGRRVGDPVTVDGIGGGQDTTITSSNWTAEGGSHTLTVVADPDGDVEESDEGDNRLTLPFAVGPDLVPMELSLSPGQPEVGVNVTVEARIANAGTEAAGPFDILVRIDDTTVIETRVDGLDPLGSTALNGTWRATADATQVTVEADVQDDVSEVSEGNNTLTVDLAVDDTVADLVAGELGARPATPDVGENVTFTLNVTNSGEREAGSFAVRFRVNGSRLDQVDVPGLATGQAVQVTSANWTAALGRSNVTAIVDPIDRIPELSLDNNRAQLVVQTGLDEDGIPTPGAVLAIALVAATALARRRHR